MSFILMLPNTIRQFAVERRLRGSTYKEIKELILDNFTFTVSIRALKKLWKKFRLFGTIQNLAHPTGRKRVTNEHLEFIDNHMEKNPECTSPALRRLLLDTFGLNLSERHVQRIRNQLGWDHCSTRYCHTVREANKPKRYFYCLQRLCENDTFDDMVFTDECTVELERHLKKMFRYKISQQHKMLSESTNFRRFESSQVWNSLALGHTHTIVLFCHVWHILKKSWKSFPIFFWVFD